MDFWILSVLLLYGRAISFICQGILWRWLKPAAGFDSLLSLTTLGAAYAFLTQPGYVRPWLLFALSIPIALSANVFRLVVTAVGAYTWDPAMAENFLHEISGMLVFSLALTALFVSSTTIGWLNRRFLHAST